MERLIRFPHAQNLTGGAHLARFALDFSTSMSCRMSRRVRSGAATRDQGDDRLVVLDQTKFFAAQAAKTIASVKSRPCGYYPSKDL